ncbi:endonuclease domain-containing 1 protein-like [Scomber scombrus]|uniref:Endonuclease domain-containing 1 protein-like n=1 Tax=Scomber scombrus TaxID=13677 RepID=A0AAV1PNT9_SCOSC|nr:endonuclease domain-containing 1 protein-like [Scomber scombrus]
MSQMMKMLQISLRALLLLLPWFGGLVIGEISQDFSQCLNFFYKETPPQGISAGGYVPICQRYNNQYHFASLYHRQHRAPLYSAYILNRADGKRPDVPWMYEPQLVSHSESPDMQPFPAPKNIYRKVKDSQAVLWDYKKSGYTRGHLNPSMHQRTMDDRTATFTLTNIVPQREGSNGYTWNQLEREVLERKAFCRGPMYVITGVMPYESVARWIKKRVSVPEYMWSAYCCPSYKSNLPDSVLPFFPTYAAVGRNDRNSGEEIVPVNPNANDEEWGYDVRRMSLQDLEGILNTRLKKRVSLFKGLCTNQE